MVGAKNRLAGELTGVTCQEKGFQYPPNEAIYKRNNNNNSSHQCLHNEDKTGLDRISMKRESTL